MIANLIITIVVSILIFAVLIEAFVIVFLRKRYVLSKYCKTYDSVMNVVRREITYWDDRLDTAKDQREVVIRINQLKWLLQVFEEKYYE